MQELDCDRSSQLEASHGMSIVMMSRLLATPLDTRGACAGDGEFT